MAVHGSEPLIFVSSNPNKAVEAERILGIPLLRVSISLPEIQAKSVEEITRFKLESARSRGLNRLIVEDVSLGFTELGEFPGPYVRWLLEAGGGKALGALAFSLHNRSAVARCCVGYWNGTEGKLFTGSVAGEILVHPEGEQNFGWDPWFRPAGEEKTFALMSSEEKDAISHRGRAYAQLRQHLEEANAPQPGEAV